MKIEKIIGQLTEFAKKLTDRAGSAFRWIETIRSKKNVGEVMDLADEISYEDLFALFDIPELMWSLDIKKSKENSKGPEIRFLKAARQKGTASRRAV